MDGPVLAFCVNKAQVKHVGIGVPGVAGDPDSGNQRREQRENGDDSDDPNFGGDASQGSSPIQDLSTTRPCCARTVR
jgi:hypothetical protein